MARPAPKAKLPPPPTAYHHGALREALLLAAESILLESGDQGFTLRACARRAGVSHAAPAHHFGNARGLLTAFAAVGFEHMAGLMQERRGAARGTALDRLVAVGQAYIDFALHHRAHFQLMFSQDRLDDNDEALRVASVGAANELTNALLAVTVEHGLPQDDLPVRMMLAWSAVHGFATLLIEGQCAQAFGLHVGDAKAASLAASQVLTLLAPALALARPSSTPLGSTKRSPHTTAVTKQKSRRASPVSPLAWRRR